MQFFVRWRVDNATLAKYSSEEIEKLYANMLKMVKEDLQYGPLARLDSLVTAGMDT